ncbi:aldo/keto reductase [Rhizobium lusitanum]|uniref:Aryl-alcohol dehydrogenase-like predicted oxidoreductase n=1 Tax=Rhizobium lusitanum TaxID=293958 RepID=A0A7X0INP0_9HYPH|nr:aldo/keto reductase [Rhizobium lusitanum]MBB6484339.1 aryl-alcohol dehydrogenase-like predicted oxidoreductase [Rhizobium lusitanum]
MRTKSLGNSGLHVSELCLGCLDFGTRLDREASFELLDTYYEAGGRFLDTANNYAFWAPNGVGGESEKMLGEWLRARGRRHDMTIATKVGAQPTRPGAGFEAAEGLGAQAIARAAEASLSRLGIDHIDLYYAHIQDDDITQEETLSAFERLRKDGKISAIACSNHSLERIIAAKGIGERNGWPAYCCLQQRYSYLPPNAGADFGPQKTIDAELKAYLQAADMPLISYATLLGGAYETGILPKAYDAAENQARLDRLRKAAQILGVTPSQAALAWARLSSGNVIPLLASGSAERLKQGIATLNITAEHLATAMGAD